MDDDDAAGGGGEGAEEGGERVVQVLERVEHGLEVGREPGRGGVSVRRRARESRDGELVEVKPGVSAPGRVDPGFGLADVDGGGGEVNGEAGAATEEEGDMVELGQVALRR